MPHAKSRRPDFIILNSRGIGNSLNLMPKYIIMIILTMVFNKFKMKLDIVQKKLYILREGVFMDIKKEYENWLKNATADPDLEA